MSGTLNSSARALSMITLLMFLNSIVGCTTNARISFDKIESKPDQPISAVILLMEIEGIMLRSGGQVHFYEQRGRYDRKAGTIRGVTPVGDSVEIRLSDINNVLVRSAGIYLTRTIIVDARNLKSDPNWRQWSVLHGRSVKRGDVLQFNKEGARYDADRRLIIGKTEIGMLVKIDIDDILFIQTKEFSPLKTVGLIGEVGLLSAGVYYLTRALLSVLYTFE